MITFALFIISGIVLITLTLTKRAEEKKKNSVFLLKAISKGDEHVRELHHHSVRLYSVGKERAHFFVKKQLPMRSKNSFNKFLGMLKSQTEKFENLLRDSRLIKKSDGISEFFKNMSTVEKGGGEISDVYEERNTEVVMPIETRVEVVEPAKIFSGVPETIKPKRKRSPRKKVSTVEEI